MKAQTQRIGAAVTTLPTPTVTIGDHDAGPATTADIRGPLTRQGCIAG
jgi:hypothetical protein